MKKHISLIIILTFSFSLFAQENNSILCGDGIDNDGDGLIDCFDSDCSNLPNDGCSICTDGISFADILIEYIPGCPLVDPDPTGAVGVSDWSDTNGDNPSIVILGEGGSIKLGFTNNLLINSGNSSADLWIFEAGDVESSSIELKPANSFTETQLQLSGILDTDGDGYYDFGNIGGATSSIDIDAVIMGYLYDELRFDAVEITDIVNAACFGNTPGADIDAICALSTIPLDCLGTPNGTAIIDACGVCLEPTDPNFNQSCSDCLGTPNGTAIIDACGVCLEPTDPNFNQSCSDCLGTPNGTAIIDACGVCFEPTDPNFNQSCSDCLGTPNGTAIIDACGVCLEPTDPNFNQSCSDCLGTPNGTAIIDACGVCLEPTDPNFNQSCVNEYKIYIPNVFSPNNDGYNDQFQVYKKQEVYARIINYKIFTRWGGLIYELKDLDFNSGINWWDGKINGEMAQTGIYVYRIEIEFLNGKVGEYEGTVTIIK